MSCGYAGCPHPEKRDGWCLYHLPKKDPDETSAFTSFVGRQIEDRASGEPNFEGFVFPAGYQFRQGQLFEKTVNFRKAVFEGDFVLEQANFPWGAIFDEARFEGQFVAKGTSFSQGGFTDRSVTFTNAQFRNTSFENTDFYDYVQFSGARFDGDVMLDHTRFLKNANFQAATFSGKAAFLSVEFHMDANFAPFDSRPTTFSKYATFAQTQFARLAIFDGALFSDDANFDNAQFQNTAIFNSCVFRGHASFFNTTFYAQADFAGTQFSLAKFHYTVFKDVVSFKAPVKGAPVLIFHFTSFEKPNEVSFYSIPFSSLSFLRTDVSETLIVPPKQSMSKKGILDEELLRLLQGGETDSKRKQSLEDALKVLQPYLMEETVIYEYKDLRKSLESNRLFNEAADLFIREMRMARDRIPHNSLEFAASWLYDKISLYGESIKRPAGLSAAVVLGVALALDLTRNLCTYSAFTPASTVAMVGNYFAYSGDVLAVFFQMRDFLHTDNLKWAPLAAEIFIRLSSLVLLGNLFIAAKRRLERK